MTVVLCRFIQLNKVKVSDDEVAEILIQAGSIKDSIRSAASVAFNIYDDCKGIPQLLFCFNDDPYEKTVLAKFESSSKKDSNRRPDNEIGALLRDEVCRALRDYYGSFIPLFNESRVSSISGYREIDISKLFKFEYSGISDWRGLKLLMPSELKALCDELRIEKDQSKSINANLLHRNMVLEDGLYIDRDGIGLMIER